MSLSGQCFLQALTMMGYGYTNEWLGPGFKKNWHNIDKNMPFSSIHLRNIWENYGKLTFISIQISELFIAYCLYSVAAWSPWLESDLKSLEKIQERLIKGEHIRGKIERCRTDYTCTLNTTWRLRKSYSTPPLAAHVAIATWSCMVSLNGLSKYN